MLWLMSPAAGPLTDVGTVKLVISTANARTVSFRSN